MLPARSNPTFSRVRVDYEEALLLEHLLYEERNRLITAKIATRNAGGDTTDIRAQLVLVRRMMDEVHRAMVDLGIMREEP